jgi:hypothetical protein
LATSAPRPASVMPAGTACGPRACRSARATIIQARATVLRAFYGDCRQLTFSSDGDPGVTRNFGSFRAAADEATLSRVFAGQYTMIDLGRPAARPPCWRLRARPLRARRQPARAEKGALPRLARTAPAAAAQAKG